MATKQHDRAQAARGRVGRLFIEHPRSLGMSWAGHGAGAVKIGAELIGAGCACIVHAAVPGWFTQTAGQDRDADLRSYDQAQSRRRRSGDWPDYRKCAPPSCPRSG